MKTRRVRILTSAGEVKVEAPYGWDPHTRQYVSPIRELWGLESNEVMSPVLEERLCYTATSTFSYEKAAKVAHKWGAPVDDSLIHRHVQKRGGRAEQLAKERLERAVDPATRADVISEAKRDLPSHPFSLVIMMDGWMIRERGAQWGLKPAQVEAERVAWHEMKTGIVFRLDQRCQTQSGRPMLLEKFMVAHRGEPFEFGQDLYAQALRRGLNQAQCVYVVADGGVWIWNLARERFARAQGVLDFYHASQHLWAVAREAFGDDDLKVKQWVTPLLHQLKHGGESGVLESLEDLQNLCAELDEDRREKIKTEVNYFTNHREHIRYQEVEGAGCPKGSGAMESACSQLQGRFKRTGQFWGLPCERRLLALELADRNGDWDEIWLINSGQT